MKGNNILPRLRTEKQIWQMIEKDTENALPECDLPALLLDADAYVYYETDECEAVTLVNLDKLIAFLDRI